MGALVSGEVSTNKVLLTGTLTISGRPGAPRVVLVNESEYNNGKYISNVVYVLCSDKTDISTLVSVYLNGTMVATTEMDLQLFLGVLSEVII